MSEKHKFIDTRFAHIKSGIKQKNVAEVKAALQELKSIQIYSDSDSAQYEEYETLKPVIIGFLYENLPLEEFLAITEKEWLDIYSTEILEALDNYIDGMAVSDLIRICNKLGLPQEHYSEKLYYRVINDPDPVVTEWLMEWVQGCLSKVDEDAPPASRHMKTISTFRYIQWMPEDKDLSTAIHLIGQRKDESVKDYLKGLLLDLPWPQDHFATISLIGAFSPEGAGENEQILKEALNKYQEPSIFRIYLLKGVVKFDFEGALALGLRDLDQNIPEEFWEEYLNWTWDVLSECEENNIAYDKNRIENLLKQLDTTNWPTIKKGYLGMIVSHHLPGMDPDLVSSKFDRFRLRIIRSFMSFRIDHMGCAIILPILLLLAWLATKGLDIILSPSTPFLQKIELGLIGLWILVIGGTSTTHFSGNETLKQKFNMAVIFWGATIMLPIAFISFRIYSIF
jgi:hypothetical protein